MEAVAFGEAADKIERLVAALGSAKVGLMSRDNDARVTSAEQDIEEALRSLDEDL